MVITEEVVKNAAPGPSNYVIRDDKIVGFGLCITPKGAKSLRGRSARQRQIPASDRWPRRRGFCRRSPQGGDGDVGQDARRRRTSRPR